MKQLFFQETRDKDTNYFNIVLIFFFSVAETLDCFVKIGKDYIEDYIEINCISVVRDLICVVQI